MMKVKLIVLILFCLCTSCNSNGSKNDSDFSDKDSIIDADTDIPDSISDDREDVDQLTDADADSLCYPLLMERQDSHMDMQNLKANGCYIRKGAQLR